MPRLGIVAGAGPLPAAVARAAHAAGRDPFLLGFEDITEPEALAGFPHRLTRLGAVGAALRALRDATVGEAILIGPVGRPSAATLRPDMRGAALLARLAGGPLGEDRILRLVVAEIEREGIRVVGPAEVAPELLAAEGRLGALSAPASATGDLVAARRALQDLGRRDLGQAVIVRAGQVVASEAADGTDAMLRRASGAGGVLVKLPKPGQDRRVDLPTIGPRTVELAAAADLTGLLVEAGATLVVDRPALLRSADRHGLFVVGVPGGA
jgi:DUF1009 family protein